MSLSCKIVNIYVSLPSPHTNPPTRLSLSLSLYLHTFITVASHVPVPLPTPPLLLSLQASCLLCSHLTKELVGSSLPGFGTAITPLPNVLVSSEEDELGLV